MATSSHRRAFELKSCNNGALFSLFDSITCGDDHSSIKGKPAPDLFLAAMKSLGFDGRADSCLVFEDAPSGVQAGLASGAQVVWIPDANLEKDVVLAARCEAVLTSMDEFDPSLFGLASF